VQYKVHYYQSRGNLIMKTIYCFCAALIVSMCLMAATVVVPVGTMQFVA